MWPACGRVPLFFVLAPRQKAGEISAQEERWLTRREQQVVIAAITRSHPAFRELDSTGFDFSYVEATLRGGGGGLICNRGLMSNAPDAN